MDKFSVFWNERICGELAVREEGLYTWFQVRCRLPEDGLWCAWVTGEQGELRLGILEPHETGAGIERRFSQSITKPIGKVQCGELRRVAVKKTLEWHHDIPVFFKTRWMQKVVSGYSDILVCADEKGWRIAIPFSVGQEFPLSALFCFAEVHVISGKRYVVFAFDKQEWPVFGADFDK